MEHRQLHQQGRPTSVSDMNLRAPSASSTASDVSPPAASASCRTVRDKHCRKHQMMAVGRATLQNRAYVTTLGLNNVLLLVAICST